MSIKMLDAAKRNRNVDSTDAKRRFGSIIKWVEKNKGEIIIEKYGKPKAVLIPYGEYDEFLRLQKEQKTQRALNKLKDLKKRVRSRNKDLTKEETEDVSNKARNEILERVVETRKDAKDYTE